MKQSLEGTEKNYQKKEIKIVSNKTIIEKKHKLALHYPKLTNNIHNTNHIKLPSISTNTQFILTHNNHSSKYITPFRSQSPIGKRIKAKHNVSPQKNKENAMHILTKLETASVIIQKHIRRYQIYKALRPKLIKIKTKKNQTPKKVKKHLVLPCIITKKKDTSSKNNTQKGNEEESSSSFQSEISLYSLHTQSIDISSDSDSFDSIPEHN